jgi:choline dehydrogenase-like flavoprotein
LALFDGRSLEDGVTLAADVCIIGAGAIGITLARRLSRAGRTIVVLESGDLEFDTAVQDLAIGDSIGLPYFPLETSRVRGLGGSTAHWGGVCRPMDAEDFEARSWIPHSGWPIGRADLEPYYAATAALLRLRKTDWSPEAWLPDDTWQPLGFVGSTAFTTLVQVVEEDDRSFARFADELDKLEDIRVLLNTSAVGVIPNEASSATDSIEAATLAGNRLTVRARVYVVASGGIENARLLLASTARSAAGVGNGRDLVGRYFGEHPRFTAGSFLPAVPDGSLAFYDSHEVSGGRLSGYLTVSRDVQRDEQIANVQVLVSANYPAAFEEALDSPVYAAAQDLPDLARRTGGGALAGHIANVLGDLGTWRAFAIPGAPLPIPYPELVGELMRRTPIEQQALIPDVLGDVAGAAYLRLYGAAAESAVLRTRIDPVPDPESRVTLGDESDALGMRRARLDWRLGALDRHSARRTMELIAAEVGRAGLGRIQLTFDEVDDAWPEDLTGGWHHTGTTRMSDDPSRGVVDRDCRVHGMADLYVAGSSVFPTPGSGSPTFTALALAMRLADHLTQVLR